MSNIEFVVLDVYDFTRADTFDAAYCRNLLQHLSRPVDVLRAMWASVRAGGVIVVEDADFDGSFCYPPDEGFDFWVAGYQQVLRHYGGDPVSGRKLAAWVTPVAATAAEAAISKRRGKRRSTSSMGLSLDIRALLELWAP